MTNSANSVVGAVSLYAAEEIRSLLGRQRRSQSALARSIGRPQPWLSARLNGATAINLDDLLEIAIGLGVDCADLLPTRRKREVEVGTPWVADLRNGRVVHLTPEGYDVSATSGNQSRPRAVAGGVQPARHTLKPGMAQYGTHQAAA